MDAFVGIIQPYCGNYAPDGWAFCHGQALPINDDYADLFKVIGITFGGNTTTLYLPDLRGRAAIGTGKGNSSSNWNLGTKTGTETFTITEANLPSHKHTVQASATAQLKVDNVPGSLLNPAQHYLAVQLSAGNGYASSSGGDYLGDTNLQFTLDIANTGSTGLSYTNRGPYVGMNYIICTKGSIPKKN